jgi:endonuclease/exonuclease/phosphatase family metal-dependent hydrolase
MKSIRVLSYNVFPGTLLSDKSLIERTRRQIEIIKENKCDIINLQEVYDVTNFKLAFENTHFIIYHYDSSRLGHAISYLIYVVLSIVISMMLLLINSNLFINYIIGLYASKYIINDLPIISWLSSDTNGLVTMVSKDITICNVSYNIYKCQAGDVMNMVKSRAYCKIDMCINGHFITVINTHLNALGSHFYQMQQLNELANTIDAGYYVICGDFNCDEFSAAINNFKQRGLSYTTSGLNMPTWDNANPLTNGWLRSANATFDYIFYKNIILLNKRIILNDEPYCSDHYGTYAELALVKK